ncbi:hypothetical protein [Paenibacillus kobensis]|uniref:hypothetical protein n=1 Tax=Paenibacillus kobensis TaxID=59841 RepID=UPI000FD9BCAC|nr:hypothetical protein [Paenibacillus kobensis]
MKALTLDLKNRETNKPVLYQSNDSSRNMLTLKVSNHTGTAVTFESGSKLRIGFANLLSAEEAKAVAVIEAGWQCAPAPLSHGAAVVLTVTKPLQLAAEACVSLTVTIPSVGKQPTSGNLTLLHSGVIGIADDETVLRFFILKPPSGNPAIPLKTGWLTDMPPIVYISSDNKHLLSSSLGLFIYNDSSTPLAKPAAAGSNPRFLISFPTILRPDPHDPVPAPGLNALTYDDLAKDIWMKVIGDGNNQWTLSPSYGSSNESLVWVLKPLSPGILGGGQSVEIIIDHIRTVLPPFVTSLHVQYVDIPGYDDGVLTLHLQKTDPKPGILLFYAEDVNIDLGEAVSLNWSTFAVDCLELSYSVDDKTIVKSSENGDILLNEKNYRLAPNKTTTLTLTAYANTGECVQKQLTITVNQLEISMGIQPMSLAPGSTATLTWKVSGSDRDKCILEPGFIELPLSGTDYRLTVNQTTTYTITAYNSKRSPNYLTAQTTVSVPPVSILSFASNMDTPVKGEAPVVLSWKTEYASSIKLEPSAELDPPIHTHPLLPVDSRTIRPRHDTTYMLSATGINGTIQKKLEVKVQTVEIVYFRAEPNDPLPGQSYKLSWETKWADSVMLDGVPHPAKGSVSIWPPRFPTNVHYTLVCTGYPGTISEEVYIMYGPIKGE